MNIFATFNDNNFIPENYIDGPTVKAIIINDKGEVLLFSSGLPGGGVEDDETNEAALARECMEEIGAVVEINRLIGIVIQYRYIPKLRYVCYGYECTLISLHMPTTTLS